MRYTKRDVETILNHKSVDSEAHSDIEKAHPGSFRVHFEHRQQAGSRLSKGSPTSNPVLLHSCEFLQTEAEGEDHKHNLSRVYVIPL